MVTLDLQTVIGPLNFILAWVLLIFVWMVSRYFTTGIFNRFFKLMRAAVIFPAVANVVIVIAGERGLFVGELLGTIFFVVLLVAFAVLLIDWQKTSLDQPLRRGKL